MAKSMHSYSKQARLSVVLSIAAAVFMVATGGVMARQYRPDTNVFLYGKSIVQMIILGGFAASCGLAFLSIVLGFNSAGQKRNEYQKKSWLGFFIGTGVMSLSLIMFYAFWTMKMSQKI